MRYRKNSHNSHLKNDEFLHSARTNDIQIKKIRFFHPNFVQNRETIHVSYVRDLTNIPFDIRLTVDTSEIVCFSHFTATFPMFCVYLHQTQFIFLNFSYFS